MHTDTKWKISISLQPHFVHFVTISKDLNFTLIYVFILHVQNVHIEPIIFIIQLDSRIQKDSHQFLENTYLLVKKMICFFRKILQIHSSVFTK